MTYLDRTSAQIEALQKKDTVRILSLETSCDETAAAIVENGRVIRAKANEMNAPLRGSRSYPAGSCPRRSFRLRF